MSIKKKEMVKYLNLITPVLERLSIDLLLNRPKNFLEYLHKWVDEKAMDLYNNN